jgi:Family of unknown function (DUF5906)
LLNKAGQPILDDEGKPRQTPAAAWLDKHKPVEQMTWAPGEPITIEDRLAVEGGWVDRKGVRCFNLYRAPSLLLGDSNQAQKWVDHVEKIYPDDHTHIIAYLAHRVQHPEEKINHALVLAGHPGIGKDTLLEPVKRAIGPWNWEEVSPKTIVESPFNGFMKSVVTRVSEVRDLGELNRFQFYEHMKAYIAAPPDMLRINEKHTKEFYIVNCSAVIFTTNYKAGGLYLPPDDRRHYIAWSPLKKEAFEQSYWDDMWKYYNDGGDRHVAAYLAELPLDKFNPKAPPEKTAGFWEIVNSNRSSEDAELDDVLDKLGNPPVVTIAKITAEADEQSFSWWLKDRKNRRLIPHRMESCGYVPVRNPNAADGLWKVPSGGTSARMVIYGRAELTPQEQLDAALKLAAWRPPGQ